MSEPRSVVTRRLFLGQAAVAAGSAAAFGPAASAEGGAGGPAAPGPIAVASGNGLEAVRIAYEKMLAGEVPVDAAVAGVNVVELDPNDMSVGYGGLPNEDGVVELDASCMDGPTHRSGAVASLRNIKTPSSVALKVMRRTDHCLLVGEGALRFARAHGFVEENLLTDRARRRWLRWKENLSPNDDWLAPPPEKKAKESGSEEERPTGTIHLSARSASGDFGATTTTSGLAWKIPGRVGDSPLLGKGMYCDNDVGSAGSTGRGESVILSCGSFAIVEMMRGGASPEQACLQVLERIVGQSRRNGLVDDRGRPTFQVNFYAIAKDGTSGGAALWKGMRYAVCDAEGPRKVDGAWLFERG